jgi:hypothetical protein
VTGDATGKQDGGPDLDAAWRRHAEEDAAWQEYADEHAPDPDEPYETYPPDQPFEPYEPDEPDEPDHHQDPDHHDDEDEDEEDGYAEEDDDDWDDYYRPPSRRSSRRHRPYPGRTTGPTFLPPPVGYPTPARPGYPGGWGARPAYRPASSSGLSLGVIALIVAALCGPAGLVVGVMALGRGGEPNSTDRICAWIAIGWGSCVTALCFGCCLFGPLSGLTTSR